MGEPKGLGQSPFRGSREERVAQEVLSRGILTQSEAKTLVRKLKAKIKLSKTEANKMNEIMEMATSGKKFSPQVLLALQSGMYKSTHELELVTKIVEKTSEGVKKTMETEV